MSAKRVELGRKMCERLAGAVTDIAPEGLGAWPEAWKVVGPASSDFMALLTRWEDTGDAALLPEIRKAYGAVLAAWKDAAERFQRAASMNPEPEGN